VTEEKSILKSMIKRKNMFVFDAQMGAGVGKREKKGYQSTLLVPGNPLKSLKILQLPGLSPGPC
jgi:hypothetical protein